MKFKICGTLIITLLGIFMIMNSLMNSTQQNMAFASTLDSSTRVCPAMNMPLVMVKKFVPPCNQFNHHCEENDSYETAYGPIEPNLAHDAYPNDQYDYYFFILDEAATVTIRVSNYYGLGQLQLRDAQRNLIGYDTYKPDGNMEVEAQLNPGTYFVRISSYDYQAPLYTFQISFPVPLPPTLPPPPPPKNMVYEDFEQALRMNWWSPDFDVFTFDLTTDDARVGNGSFQIDYEKTDTYQFMAAQLAGGETHDLSWAEALDVWIYGDESILLKIEQAGGFQEDVQVLTSTNSLDWTLFRFDLSQATTIDRSQITQFMFFPAPGNATANGSFKMDHIVARDNYGLLEDFEFGRLMDWWTPDSENFQYYESDEMICNVLKVEYQKDAQFQFIGAEVPPLFRDWQWARGIEILAYGEVSLLVVLEDDQLVQVPLGTLTATDPDGWTTMRFFYDFVTNEINLNEVRNILFFVEPGYSNAQGIFYIDDISLIP